MTSLRRIVLALLVACSVASGGCASSAKRPADPGQPSAAEERAAFERGVRRLFPEIEGEVTRESIARAIATGRDEHGRPGPIAPSDPTGGVRAAAIQAIEAGDFPRAFDLLSELLASEDLVRARTLLASGDARAALAALDHAVEVAARSASVLCLRASVALSIGVAEHETRLVEASLNDFLAAAAREPSAQAWLGASRAARALDKGDDALEYARRGMRALPEHPAFGERTVAAGRHDPLVALLEPAPPERTLAEASFDAWARARGANLPADVAGGYWRESREALEGLVGRAPEDAWTWAHLAELHASQGAFAEARAVALRGLEIAPEDEDLHTRLASACAQIGGGDAVVATYEAFALRHPDVAAAHWHPALARFEAALVALRAGRDARAEFERAEKGFARCRALAPDRAAACRDREALCRSGTGWSALAAGDLEAARKSFLSMEDVRPGSLASGIEERLQSGVVGLDRIGDVLRQRIGNDPNSLERLDDLERAARIYDFLHEYQPRDARWAGRAGALDRDTAVALELKARGLCGQGKTTEAGHLRDRARELMERALRACEDATALSPDDPRAHADAGRVLACYLQRDASKAEAFLARAIELGEAQLSRLPDAAREAARTTLGDACQNLGVLHLTLRGDARAARAAFEKSLAVDPEGRVEARQYLERCDQALAQGSSTLLEEKNRWAAACTPREN